MHLTSSSRQGQHTARLNRLIQVALISGLSVSMLIMAIGTVLYFLHNTAGGPFMRIGVIVLMVTPALRVAVAALGYLLDGDRVFALVSAGVLVVLAASLVIGAA
jgi:uncharacterized membrane protein